MNVSYRTAYDSNQVDLCPRRTGRQSRPSSRIGRKMQPAKKAIICSGNCSLGSVEMFVAYIHSVGVNNGERFGVHRCLVASDPVAKYPRLPIAPLQPILSWPIISLPSSSIDKSPVCSNKKQTCCTSFGLSIGFSGTFS